MSEALYNRYRPQQFADVIGQTPIVRSLKKVLASGSNHAFLLAGPSGVGKTTIARIAAHELECDDDLLEVDAAVYTGIDDMRSITQGAEYKPFGNARRVIVLDECHALSKQAWGSLLKSLEESPDWLYWFLCTTDPSKVPATIQTRCTRYNLKSVARNELFELLEAVALEERMFEGLPEDARTAVIDLCAQRAQGSPRAALVNLGACSHAKGKDDARRLLVGLEEEGVAVDLAKLLVRGATWDEARERLVSLKDENPESIRQVVRAYVTTIVLNNKKTNPKYFAILEAFGTPFAPQDQMTPLIMACANLLLA